MRPAIFCAALAGNLVFLAFFGAPVLAKAIHRLHVAAPKTTGARVIYETERTEIGLYRDARDDEPAAEVEAEAAADEKPTAPAAPVAAPAAAPRKPAPARAASPTPTFDPKQLEAALASRIDELPMCRRGGGPEGPGVAEVLFLPEGRALVKLSEPYVATASGACIARRLSAAALPFDGAPVTLRVRFSL